MDHVGIDVHQKYSQVCEMVEGEVVSRVRVATTEAWLRRHFEGRARLRILIECGGSSRWVARLLRELGHQVVVLNPRRVRLIAESTLKTDAIDAEILARLAGLDPEFLQPVYQRRSEAEALRTRLGGSANAGRGAHGDAELRARDAALARVPDGLVRSGQVRRALLCTRPSRRGGRIARTVARDDRATDAAAGASGSGA